MLAVQTGSNLLLLVIGLSKVRNEDARAKIALGCHLYVRLSLVPNLCSFSYALISSGDLVIVLIATAGLALQLLLMANYELFFFNFSLQLNDNFSRNPRNLWELASRATLAVFSCVPSTTSLQVTFVLLLVMSVGYGFATTRASCVSNHFHNPVLGKVQGVLSMVHLTVNGSYLLIYTIQNDMISKNEAVFLFGVLAFALKFYLNYRNYRLKGVLGETPGKFSNES